jgi:hypothetical protein
MAGARLLDAVRLLLVPAEWELLAFAGRLITFEQAIRFLGDYLNGDVYYKTHRSGQNLDRARVQFKLLARWSGCRGRWSVCEIHLCPPCR